MFPILSSSSSVHSLSSGLSCLISLSFSFIIFMVLCPLVFPPFYCLQFLSSLAQYSLLYLLSNHPNSFLAVDHPSNSPLLKVPSSISCLLMSSISCQYSFSYSSIASFVFFRFSLPSQMSDFVVNPFHHTKYLSFPLTHHLFSILLTFHSSFPSIMTRASCSFFCPLTCPTYLCILLVFTTRCILIVLGSSNSTVFADTILFTL